MKPKYFLALTVSLTTLTSAVLAEEYSPYADQTYPTTVYFGDTHVHTNLSADAAGGGTMLTPNDSYRFAKGAIITGNNGMKVRLHRPLDFLVVADHAFNMGVIAAIRAEDPVVLQTPVGKRWAKIMRENPFDPAALLKPGGEKKLTEIAHSIFAGDLGFFWNRIPADHVGHEGFRKNVWTQVAATADHHNIPGKFTAFTGYEWTSDNASKPPGGLLKGSGNLHRVVIFKDSADVTTQILPFSSFDSKNPAQLWDFLERYEKQTGGEVIAIPHGANVSNGEMFSLADFEGRPLSLSYAKTRRRWEPLFEVTQMKGDSETHPLLSPADEFADYETWNGWGGKESEGVKTKEEKRSEYARSALKRGLALQDSLTVNPFKFGMIGSTDTHSSLSVAEEDNFWGGGALSEPTPNRSLNRTAAAGYAAVWATENTREALFAAMKRKETYATTGPRMTVRFFGGWDYEKTDAARPDLARIGYDGGVPMGGDLIHAPKGQAPKFLIRAVKDPDGANLDRVQVIKGWQDKNGELQEKVYNVALSDGRKDKGNRTRKVGSTVDVKDVSYTNNIGDPELATVWTDPDFNPQELAFYYVRVLEIPTPRWTAYDAKFFKLNDVPKEVPMVTQERAYTSPIWYTPN